MAFASPSLPMKPADVVNSPAQFRFELPKGFKLPPNRLGHSHCALVREGMLNRIMTMVIVLDLNPFLFIFKASLWQEEMHSPHIMQSCSLRTVFLFSLIIAFCLHSLLQLVQSIHCLFL